MMSKKIIFIILLLPLLLNASTFAKCNSGDPFSVDQNISIGDNISQEYPSNNNVKIIIYKFYNYKVTNESDLSEFKLFGVFKDLNTILRATGFDNCSCTLVDDEKGSIIAISLNDYCSKYYIKKIELFFNIKYLKMTFTLDKLYLTHNKYPNKEDILNDSINPLVNLFNEFIKMEYQAIGYKSVETEDIMIIYHTNYLVVEGLEDVNPKYTHYRTFTYKDFNSTFQEFSSLPIEPFNFMTAQELNLNNIKYYDSYYIDKDTKSKVFLFFFYSNLTDIYDIEQLVKFNEDILIDYYEKYYYIQHMDNKLGDISSLYDNAKSYDIYEVYFGKYDRIQDDLSVYDVYLADFYSDKDKYVDALSFFDIKYDEKIDKYYKTHQNQIDTLRANHSRLTGTSNIILGIAVAIVSLIIGQKIWRRYGRRH